MDNKMFNNKPSNFFKKEGFYVILFICLCIVAGVAAVAAKNSSHRKNAPIKNEAVNNQSASQISGEDKLSASIEKASENNSEEHMDAKQVSVKKPQNTSSKSNNIEIPKNVSQAKSSVSTNTLPKKSAKLEFKKPVEGTLAREFSNGQPVYWDSTNVYREHNGIDIKAEIGKPVYAAMDGTVEAINFDNYGQKIVLKHSNGIKTVYANLDENVLVKKGMNVKAGTQMGKVGNTSTNAGYEKYGSHLHFEVLNGDNYEDPLKYVKYDALKQEG